MLQQQRRNKPQNNVQVSILSEIIRNLGIAAKKLKEVQELQTPTPQLMISISMSILSLTWELRKMIKYTTQTK